MGRKLSRARLHAVRSQVRARWWGVGNVVVRLLGTFKAAPRYFLLLLRVFVFTWLRRQALLLLL